MQAIPGGDIFATVDLIELVRFGFIVLDHTFQRIKRGAQD